MNVRERHDLACEAFNNHDADAVAAEYAAEAIVYDPLYPEPLRGRDAVREDHANLFRAFADIIVHRSVFIANGNTAAWEVTVSGTHSGPLDTPEGIISPTYCRIEQSYGVIADIDHDGRFLRVRRYTDPTILGKQLELIE